MKGLVLTYIITAIGGIAGLRYPLIGLNIYVGLAVLRPQFIFGFAGDLSDLSLFVGVLMLVGWALQGFGSWRFGRARPIVLALVAYVAWFMLSGTQAMNTQRAVRALEELLKIALPFLAGVTLMQSAKDWRTMLWTIVLSMGYVGFEQNLSYLIKGYNAAYYGFGGMDNNTFGAGLVAAMGPAVALALSAGSWTGRALAGVSAALILHTILLTFSRGTLVGLVAMGIAAVIMMPKRPKYFLAVFLVAILAIRFTGPQLASRYATILASGEERDASAQSRVDLWLDCLDVVRAYPIVGVGPSNWRTIAASYGWPEGKSAHSVWMETAAEVGIPGFLFLFGFFLIALVRLWPVARERIDDTNRDQVLLASGVVLGLVGYMVAGQFVSVQGMELPYFLVMLGAAMLKAQPVPVAEPAPPVPALPPAFQWTPPRRSTPGLGRR
jgi:probable O-glycosylation ligase (exosortase A-associated)